MLEYKTSHSDTGTEINKCLSHVSARDSAKIQLSSNIFLDQNILDKHVVIAYHCFNRSDS